ncbi:hypothetical protein HK102_010061, partial [Quaeritorhiza haematococci]
MTPGLTKFFCIHYHFTDLNSYQQANVILRVYLYRLSELIANPNVQNTIVDPGVSSVKDLISPQHQNFVLLLLFACSLVFNILFHTLRLARLLFVTRGAPPSSPTSPTSPAAPSPTSPTSDSPTSPTTPTSTTTLTRKPKKSPTPPATAARILALFVVLKGLLLCFDLITNGLFLYEALVYRKLGLFETGSDNTIALVLSVVAVSPLVTLTTNALVNLPLHFFYLRMQLGNMRVPPPTAGALRKSLSGRPRRDSHATQPNPNNPNPTTHLKGSHLHHNKALQNGTATLQTRTLPHGGMQRFG